MCCDVHVTYSDEDFKKASVLVHLGYMSCGLYTVRKQKHILLQNNATSRKKRNHFSIDYYIGQYCVKYTCICAALD